MIKLFSSKYIILFSIFYFLFSGASIQAAEVFFGANSQEVGVGEKFEIGVFINTEGQAVNAVEGSIIFPEESLEFQGVQNGGSVLTLWIKQPEFTAGNGIRFSGLTPGGFEGSRGYLFSAIFTAKKTASVSIESANEKILLNDGTGTRASVSSAPLELSVSEVIPEENESFVPLYDPDPPEPFFIRIAKDGNVFSGRWFLVFNTQDKGSGIDHYEVLERRQSALSAALSSQQGTWVNGQSPYLLQDQELHSAIFVKAVDRAGNFRVESLAAPERLAWYHNSTLWVIIIVITALLLFSFVLKKFLWRRQP